MQHRKNIAFVGTICAVLLSGAARADTIVWKDPVHGFTVSYPDSWRVQTADAPSTRLRVAAPVGGDMATCRVQAWKDGRAKIYPKGLMDEAVTAALGMEYWEQEAPGEYDGAQILDYRGPVGLGNKGDATAVRVSFTQSDGASPVPMTGIMTASLYGDKLYQASCSARADAYERWSPLFASIMQSVELDTRYHPFAVGYYRDFLADPKLSLPREKPGTTKERFKGGWFSWLMTDKYHK